MAGIVMGGLSDCVRERIEGERIEGLMDKGAR
jgi:hypothetical protein